MTSQKFLQLANVTGLLVSSWIRCTLRGQSKETSCSLGPCAVKRAAAVRQRACSAHQAWLTPLQYGIFASGLVWHRARNRRRPQNSALDRGGGGHGGEGEDEYGSENAGQHDVRGAVGLALGWLWGSARGRCAWMPGLGRMTHEDRFI